MPEKKSLYEELMSGIADAITDIRQRVVEEPWFGKVVTEQKVTELNWGWPPLPDKQPEAGAPEQDHERDVADSGIDR